MADDTERQKTNNDEVSPAASEAISPSLSEEVAAPAPLVTQPPAVFLRLKTYCDEHKLKCEFDLNDVPDVIGLEFKNGRATRTVYIAEEEAAENLLQYPLEELVFLGEYAAICSCKGRWIEAAIRPHGIGAIALTLIRNRIFGVPRAQGGQEPREIEITGPAGLTIRLSEKRGCLFWLDYKALFYLRIEGIGITEHDKATSLLEDLANAIFLQIDLRSDIPLGLAKERGSFRRFRRSRGKLDEFSELAFPRFSYERNPSSLYWYARGASSMPLLQFLAFYQCIEFFFPQYSRQETIRKDQECTRASSI